MTDSTQLVATAALALALIVYARRALHAARRAVADHRPEDVLTVVAAVIATIVQADGMWIFFRDIVPVPVYLRVVCFAFLEVAMFASGLRARRNVRETEEHTAGVDGMAVWALAGVSATLASTAAGSFRGALLRLAAAAVAAWLWERSLSGERRRARKKDRQRERRINLRITPERILVRLGIAESTDRTATEVDAHRRLSRVARRAKQLRTLQATGAKPKHQLRAQQRLDRAIDAAVEHAGLANVPGRQDALMAQIAVLYNAAALAQLDPEAPWEEPVTRPRLRLIRNSEVRREVGEDVPGDVPDERLEQDEQPRDEAAEEEQEPPADERPADIPVFDPAELERLLRTARRKFRRALASGTTPSIAELKSALRIGQDKAKAVQAALAAPGTERGA